MLRVGGVHTSAVACTRRRSAHYFILELEDVRKLIFRAQCDVNPGKIAQNWRLKPLGGGLKILPPPRRF